MTTPVEQPVSNHRRQRLLLAGLSTIALALALVPRQERALFITEAVGLRAFAAAVPPPIDFASLARLPNLVDSVGPRGFYARTPGRPVGSNRRSAAPVAEDFTTPTAPFVPDDQPVAGEGQGPTIQNAAVPAFPSSPGDAFPFLPAGLNQPGASPVAQAVTPTTPIATATPTPTATATPTPTPSASPTPTPAATATPVVPAVPEPATWALMILGFGGVGGLLRRDRGTADRLRRV
ncbi:PEPxxWA-CTERM sorting domain-containing protein [Sphingomonas sp.]|uniref:PEPxxWA-CTERM sorting domain-containing protein n=1 Tax=Sphingomonas sp. TaxID=28214 RepID=UPI003CC56CBF